MCAAPAPSPPPDAPPLRFIVGAAALLALAALLAYAGSFSVPFVFDDVPSIVDNASLRQLWPLWSALTPPPETLGLPVGGRPLVNLSLALNYALGGTAPAGYHAFNLLVHILAALALFGVARRTLLRPILRERFGAAALPLAFALAALWMLHPLQTESVTYVCQRAESLMALAYLTTLYTFIRGVDAPVPAQRRWHALTVIACVLGMACKEVMVSAPLLVLLYDRTFCAGRFSAAWRLRGRLYTALAATWLLLAALVVANFHRGGTAGFETGVTPWTYALTQCHAIVHYLRLALWPHPLVFDYGIETVQSATTVALPGLLLLGLLALTLLALRHRPALGFLGAWFFAILAPTSSIVPVATQTMAEHRMYLPLAAVTALIVLGLHGLARRSTLLVCIVLAVVLGCATARRNADYRTELDLWADTIAQHPENSRAHGNLGILLFKAGRTADAIARFEAALRLRPDFPEARANLGAAFLGLGRPQEAALHSAEALRLQPDSPDTRSNLGLALKQLGRTADAMREFSTVLRAHPDHADANHNLGIALLEAGKTTEAIAHFETALRTRPAFANAHSNLGVALMRMGRHTEAISHYETALRLDPGSVAARDNLAALRAHLETSGRSK